MTPQQVRGRRVLGELIRKYPEPDGVIYHLPDRARDDERTPDFAPVVCGGGLVLPQRRDSSRVRRLPRLSRWKGDPLMAATKNRVFRIADELYAPAQDVALDHDDSLSDVVRLALAGYVESARNGTEGTDEFMRTLRRMSTSSMPVTPQFA
ncbi:hypothetical protein GCM10025867_45430 (plasmid) [Frondihabitans sucicola]|uniref:Uncharacterized protein n=2 Tax=Frondihabitans sucicola TaxID=1268041 RepID=A0ABM8GV12_9MICO|nr:hypothetical protein [Frondihabitans sucicola]BDZ52302.1 hypothetical protein GCM10025867_45430 [Frondihabitans sucicola]